MDVNPKRYRYTAKEHDDETGLYYHVLRYYAPWLGKWIAVDPLYINGHNNNPSHSGYKYTKSRPTKFIDPLGLDIQIHPDSQITAEEFVSALRVYFPRLAGSFRVTSNNSFSIDYPSTRERGRPIDLPEWFSALVTASSSNQWVVTTGRMQLQTLLMKRDLIPDIPEGLMYRRDVISNPWSQSNFIRSSERDLFKV